MQKVCIKNKQKHTFVITNMRNVKKQSHLICIMQEKLCTQRPSFSFAFRNRENELKLKIDAWNKNTDIEIKHTKPICLFRVHTLKF